MKKIFTTFILLTIFLSNSIFAFDWELLIKNTKILRWDIWENFYRDIDNSVWNLTEWFYQREFLWRENDWKITKILNKVAASRWLEKCFTKETTFNDIDLFIDWNIWLIKKILDDECTKILPANTYEAYNNVIIEVHKSMKEKWVEKMKNVARLIKTWIYSDWNTNNSSFDLIDDLLQIHKVIFNQESNYYWDKTKTIWDLTFDPESFIQNILKWNNTEDSLEKSQKWQNQIGADIKIENPLENLRITPMVDWNSIMCPPTSSNNESGLNSNTYKALTNSLTLTWDNWNNMDNSVDNSNTWAVNEEETEKTPTNYKKNNDDNIWPCNEIFCIHFWVITKDHNLLWWWQVKTIEGIITRANEHLKPFANSNLEAKKMWVNNFEIWTLDLNLPDLFHVNVILRTEPVPILDIKKLNNNENLWSLTVDNMLEKYFSKAWLQYKRENDLTIAEAYDVNTKTTNKVKMHNLRKAAKFADELNNLREEEKKAEIWSFDRLIQNEIEAWEWSEVYSMLSELASFTIRIKSYSQDLNILIKKMKEIPSI